MYIRIGNIGDLETVLMYDKHISKDELNNLIRLNRVFIVQINDKFAGWLRYNLFWDNMPFMNMLYLLEDERRKGYGKLIVEYWENEMKKLGHKNVLTSTASDEYAQHFYMKLGYRAVGGFIPEGDPYEIILSKRL